MESYTFSLDLNKPIKKIDFISVIVPECVNLLINDHASDIIEIYNAGEATEEVYRLGTVIRSIQHSLEKGVKIWFIAGPIIESYSTNLKKDKYNIRHIILQFAEENPDKFFLYRRLQDGFDVARNHKFYLFCKSKKYVLQADVNKESIGKKGSEHEVIVRQDNTGENLKEVLKEIDDITSELLKADKGGSKIYSRYLPNDKIENRFPIRATTPIGNIFCLSQYIIFLIFLFLAGLFGFLSFLK